MCEYCGRGMARKFAGEAAALAKGSLLPGAFLSSLAMLAGFPLAAAIVSWGTVLAVSTAVAGILRICDVRFTRRWIIEHGEGPMCGRRLSSDRKGR